MRFLHFLICCCVCFSGFSLKAQEQYAIRVVFAGKDATTYSLTQPQAYLSERAINRRSKYGLAIDSTDLPVPTAYVNQVLTTSQGVLHTTSKWHNSCVVLVADTTTLALVRTFPFVQNTHPVGYYQDGLHQKPTGPSPSGGAVPLDFDENYYGAAWDQINLCRGAYLHEQGLMGQGVLIAVIDVGFNGVPTIAAFDSLRAGSRIADVWNFIEQDDQVYQNSGHGTQVLSCMAALLPQTFVGTAPYATYALYTTDHLSTEQSIEEDNWVAAIERADSLGADLVNSSLGYNEFDQPEDTYTYAQLDGQTTLVARAANIATAKGMTVISSAGNEGNNNWHYLLTPGDADSALTVGASDINKQVATFSSRGPNAAGVLKPDVAAMGVAASVINGSGQVVQQNGTSIATPILTGLVACLFQARPNTTPAYLRAVIRAAGHLHEQPNYELGHGVPDFYEAYQQITAIKEQEQTANPYYIYPNPARDGIYIRGHFPSSGVAISLFSLSGQGLLERHLNGQHMHYVGLPALPQGIYLLKLKDKNGIFFEKLVIE